MVNIQTQQILLNRPLYIGDRATLQCDFTLEMDFLNQVSENSIELSANYFTLPVDYSSIEIRSIELLQKGQGQYSFIINFTPWTTEPILLPEYNLSAALSASQKTETDYSITFETLHVTSLARQQGITTIKDEVSPLLLLGTTYKLFALIFAAVLILVFFVRLLVKHREVIEFFKGVKLKLKYRRNLKLAESQLIKLKNDSSVTPHDMGENIQRIMRLYLEVRFDYPFTRTVSSDFIRAFSSSNQPELVDYKIDACSEISAVFKRTDYLRYSGDAALSSEEKNQIIENLINAMEDIEKPVAPSEKENKEEADV